MLAHRVELARPGRPARVGYTLAGRVTQVIGAAGRRPRSGRSSGCLDVGIIAIAAGALGVISGPVRLATGPAFIGKQSEHLEVVAHGIADHLVVGL